MFQKTTNGIEINVNVEYKNILDPRQEGQNIFMYLVSIKNTNNFPVQLTYRKWLIFDAKEFMHEVEGPGVVGETPILQKDEEYTYTSWTNIKSYIGYMEGIYTMVNLNTQEEFIVDIPRFDLVVPYMKN